MTRTYFTDKDIDIGYNFMSRSQLLDLYPHLSENVVSSSLWGWGSGRCGALGTGSTSLSSTPVQTIAGGNNWKQVSGGGGHSAATKTDGTLWTWGYNCDGQLGDNTTANKSSPVQTVAGGNDWRSAAAGGWSSAGIRMNGQLWTWGWAWPLGALGDSRSSPVQTTAGGTNWKQVNMQDQSTTALKTDGTLWVWGLNYGGVLGTNNVTNISTPVQTVAGGNTWNKISSGGNYSSAGIKTDGTLWVWGCNHCGLLGDNSVIDRSSPVQTAAGGTNWKQISMSYHSAAIKTDGTLWTWGFNCYGEAGLHTDFVSSPTQIAAGGTNWKEVVVSARTTHAIKTDGSLWGVGEAYGGIMGQVDLPPVNISPVQTALSDTKWRSVAKGAWSTLFAIREE